MNSARKKVRPMNTKDMAAGSSHHSHHGAEALPDEVLTEILSRLPAKSVGRFRCVSRGWFSTLSSDYFIDLHRQRANNSRPGHHPRLLLAPGCSSNDRNLYSWQPGPSRGDGSVEKLMRGELGLQGVVTTTRLCRGLVLIRATNRGGGYYVVNPCTGEALALPDSREPSKMAYRNSAWWPPRSVPEPPRYASVSYGLGYCETTKEYKVVRFFSGLLPKYDRTVFAPTSCEVLVLGTPAAGYYWRPSAGRPPVCSVMREKPCVFLHGYLHFLCSDEDGDDIVTFSVSDETFGWLLLPPDFDDMPLVLTELDDRLCVCYGEPNSDDPYHVYVLMTSDYEEAETQWEKLFCIDRTAWPESERKLLRSRWIAPVGVMNGPAGGGGAPKIMFGTGSCIVFALDHSSNGGGGDPEILFTPENTIVGSCWDVYSPTVGLYEESLIPVGRTVEDMVLSSPATAAWFNILKWLPTRSVSELRMVCREWRGLIMSDCFIRSHVVHANLKRSPHIMFVIDPRFNHFVHLEECIRNPELLRPLPPDFVACSQPCHGLNVWSSGREDFICNPIMRFREPLTFDDNDDMLFAGRIGLGYNTEFNEHVLVHISYKWMDLNTRSYQLNCLMKRANGEGWYRIDPPPRPIADMQSTFLNGKIYWIVESDLGPVSARCEIVAFNVKTEEFEVLQGPPCDHDVGHMTILELYGKLCISHSGQSRNTLDLWLMKDVGIWLMEYHIVLDKLSEKAAPLAIDPTDGRILLNTGLSLGYYDPETTTFETLVIAQGIPDYLDSQLYPIVCHESLLVCPLQY